MSKSLLFSGYFGFGNTGDEAIIEALCQEVCRQETDINIMVATDNTEFAQYLGVTPVPRKNVVAMYKAMRQSDLLISGGGGLLQDTTGIGSVVYYLGVMVLARLAARKVMVMCQGLGPLRKGLSRFLVKTFLPWVNASTWRDECSIADVQKMAPRLDAKLCADPALLLEPAPEAEVTALREQNGLTNHFFVIALRQWAGLEIDNVVRTMSLFLEDDEHVHLAVVPFQESQDLALAKDFAQRLNRFATRVHVVQGGTPRQLLGLIKESQLVIAMRLHALIFAAAQSVPFVGIAYDPKVARFCERCGASYISLEKTCNTSLELLLREARSNKEALRQRIVEASELMREAVRTAVSQALQMAGE